MFKNPFTLLPILFFMLSFGMMRKALGDESTQTVRAVIPDPTGLVAHYEFEGDTVNTSGFQPPADSNLVGNPTYGLGVFGQAIDLDGDDDYVDCGNETFFNITDQITVAAWIKVNEFDKKFQTIIAKGDNSWRLARVGDSNNVEFACNGTAATRWTGEGEIPWAVSGTTGVNDGKWHHVAGVFDGTQLYLYIDGVLEAAKGAAKSVDISNYNVCIGANAQVPGREWNGFLDDVRIYNYALSQAEIVSIMGKNEIHLLSLFPATLYDIAKRYDGLKKFEEAKDVCQLILQQHPDSSSAHGAQLYLSKRNILSLIKSKEFTTAQAEFDDLIADFNDHSDLSEALYAIAQAYSPPRKFKEAESVYKQLIQLFPDSPYAVEALFNAPKLHIFSLLKSENYTEAQIAIDKFVADFNDHPALPGVVYWFAKEVEASKTYDKAKSMYQQVVRRYPESSHVASALLSVSKMDVFSLIESGNDTMAQEALDTLIADFYDHTDLPEAVFVIGEQYYYKAFDDSNKCIKVKSEENLKKAKDIWEMIVAQWPKSKSIGLKYAQYFPAVCYRYLGEYEKAKVKYEQFTQELPKHAFTVDAYYYWAACCCHLGQYEEAKSVYQEIIQRYPGSSQAQNAQFNIARLNLLSLSQEDRQTAISFFESQHRNWLAIRSGSARYEVHVPLVSFTEGKLLVSQDQFSTGTIEFTVTPADNPTNGKKPAWAQVRIYSDKNRCGFVKSNVFDSKESWQHWTDDPSLPTDDILKQALDSGLFFYPLDLMAQTYPDTFWNNVYMMPKKEFFVTRGIPVRGSTQEETDDIFGGEQQYLFMFSYTVTDAHYWFSAENGLLRQIDVFKPNGTVMSFRYENYVAKQGGSVQFPQRFILTRKQAQVEGNKASLRKLTVELSDVQLNIDIPAERFIVQ
ncbi:MAG: LamG-like jellyroll fold domain-containing protein [Planctomycetota bacterium]|jgi:pentatricopeptide repeat protein